MLIYLYLIYPIRFSEALLSDNEFKLVFFVISSILVILLVIRPLISHAFEAVQSSDTKLVGDSGRDDNMLLSSFLNDDMSFDEMILVCDDEFW